MLYDAPVLNVKFFNVWPPPSNVPVKESETYATKADIADLKVLLNNSLANIMLTLKGVSNESSSTDNTNDVSGQ